MLWWTNGFHHHSTKISYLVVHVKKPSWLLYLPSPNYKGPPLTLPLSHTTSTGSQETTTAVMLKLRNYLILLLILLCLSSSGQGISDDNGIKPAAHLKNKIHGRELLVVEATVLDYDYGGPNSRHDPRKGKPGIGGKNP